MEDRGFGGGLTTGKDDWIVENEAAARAVRRRIGNRCGIRRRVVAARSNSLKVRAFFLRGGEGRGVILCHLFSFSSSTCSQLRYQKHSACLSQGFFVSFILAELRDLLRTQNQPRRERLRLWCLRARGFVSYPFQSNFASRSISCDARTSTSVMSVPNLALT
jgi:hypothetical protein